VPCSFEAIGPKTTASATGRVGMTAGGSEIAVPNGAGTALEIGWHPSRIVWHPAFRRQYVPL